MLQSMASQRVGHDLAIEQQQSCRTFLRVKGTKQSLRPRWERKDQMGGDREVEEGASNFGFITGKIA